MFARQTIQYDLFATLKQRTWAKHKTFTRQTIQYEIFATLKQRTREKKKNYLANLSI